MKAARLHAYQEALKVDSIDEPRVEGPFDVVVRIGAAGLCRTDLHIQEGQWAEKSQVRLPYTPGHENAGWVHEIGSGVSNVQVGDTVIVHPFISCGLCTPCRRGDDMHCVNGSLDRKSTRLNSSHVEISYAVFCLKKKTHLSAAR